MKICSKCGAEKSTEPDTCEFNKHSDSRDGLSDICKTCSRENYRQYAEENAEQERERKRQWARENYRKNRAKILAKAEAERRAQGAQPRATQPRAVGSRPTPSGVFGKPSTWLVNSRPSPSNSAPP
jgi:hypothetical protein